MLRDKKLVLLSHCLLNVNAKVYGLANYKGAHEELIKFLIEENFGIIQLPCPELGCEGIRRWGKVKEQLDIPFYRKYCNEIFTPLLEQIIDYHKNGYRLAALIGVNGSPSCGVSKTCSAASWGGEINDRRTTEEMMQQVNTIESPGIFIEQIRKLLEANKIYIPMLAIEEADPAASIADIKKVLRGEG
ncbi:MAG: DUF523 domain-containing protein [Eubacteriales bacterium]|uniref:CD3072 family TudS-related putative desulfidase n=1 Tax=Syntrophomonas wolfei TaxID=863 RepID=UPI00077310CA|nr:CD3072 family TudS-related putative desulfidase [Syntrophomonas wolfei]MDD4390423.1 DUF523 domain-containing protein [Eubacteriales bacterium]